MRSELVGVAELATHYNTSTSTVSNWVYRYEDFPEPVVRLRMGPVWVLGDVEAWMERRWPDDE